MKARSQRVPEVSLSRKTREESRSEGGRNCNEALMLKNFQVKDQKVLKRLERDFTDK